MFKRINKIISYLKRYNKNLESKIKSLKKPQNKLNGFKRDILVKIF